MQLNQYKINQCQNKLCVDGTSRICEVVPHEVKSDNMLARYLWAKTYKCPQCNTVYYKCMICDDSGSSSKLLYRSRLYRHNKIHFSDVLAKYARPDKRCKINDSICTDKGDETIRHVIIQNAYDRPETMKYMELNTSDTKPNRGPSYLVGRALSETNNLHENIDTDDIMLHLLMAKFVAKLTKNQRLEFALILKMIERKNKRDVKKKESNSNEHDNTRFQFHTCIPISDSAIRNTYTIGTYSILKNLPRPKVIMVDGHSYVSIKQCILYILGCGKMPPDLSVKPSQKVQDLSESIKYREVYQRARTANPNVSNEDLVVITGITWSDDFDPNSSIKANRGAVWIRTVTFITQTFNENKFDDTYTISIGLKQQSHDVVEREFLNELKELKSGTNNIFFCKQRQHNVRVHFEVIVFLADQPERRSLNYLMLGNSKFGSRFSYCADIESISEIFPMCTDCLKRCQMDTDFLRKGFKCINCLQWNLMATHDLAQFPVPKDYPSEMIPIDGDLKPIRVTFDALKEVVYLATQKYMDGKWTANNVISYASSWTINTNGQNKIIEHCNNMKTLKIVQDRQHIDKNIKDTVLSDYKTEPHKYEQWKGGVYWNSSTTIDCFIDVIMHLLFLGIVKASKELLSQWISLNKEYKKYDRCTKYMFKSITELGLDWCKVINTNTGWVSDNYLAYARILKWIYHPISMLQWDQKLISEESNVFTPIIADSFVGSLLSTISSIMTRVVDDCIIREVEREIKVYLSHVNSFHDMISNSNSKTNKRKPKRYWLRKYNFLSLLNIPDTMYKYGPLVNLWEGSNQGEGFLRYAKPRITDIHSKNWQINAHIKLLNMISMNEVIECHVTNRLSDDQKNEYITHMNQTKKSSSKRFHTYQSIDEVFSLFRRNMPLSIVKVCRGGYYIIVAGDSKETFNAISILFKYKFHIPTVSMYFHNIIMNLSMIKTDLIPISKSDIKEFILALPELSINGYINEQCGCSYYVIDSHWNELDQQMQFKKPKSPGCKY